MFDWMVRTFVYKPFDIVDDWVRSLSAEQVEYAGFVTFVVLFVWLLHKTTNIAVWIGLKEVKGNE